MGDEAKERGITGRMIFHDYEAFGQHEQIFEFKDGLLVLSDEDDRQLRNYVVSQLISENKNRFEELYQAGCALKLENLQRALNGLKPIEAIPQGK